MKTAYELAMERLSKSSPSQKLTDEQKAELAELDAKYAAKVAEKEIHFQGQIAAAQAQGDYGAAEVLEQQVARERGALKAELEEKKEKVRQQKS